MSTRQTNTDRGRRLRLTVRLAVCSALLPFAFYLLPFAFPAAAQEVIDRMMAVVNGRELITYTDLLWQLALEPDTPLDDPRAEDLGRALDLLVDQRLVLSEAEKLPTIAPTDKEVDDELKDLIRRFPSGAEFYRRLNRVGLFQDSEQLREIVRQRVAMKNYIEFRFGSFIVVTEEEVKDYYRDVWVPRRRRQAPGSIVPALEQAYAQVETELREAKKASDIDEFLEDARATAEIILLDENATRPAGPSARPGGQRR